MKKLIRHWQKYPDIICGTTTKSFGSVTKNLIPEDFYRLLNISGKRIIIADQVHGDKIALVNGDNRHALTGIDGLLTKEKGLLLTVRTADCVPIFFYEPQIKLVGIIHAGWKGTYKGIAVEMIRKAKKAGASLDKLKIFIGPHIKSCCYEVNQELADKFINKFQTKKIVKKIKDRIILDLEEINIIQLLKAGVKMNNLKTSIYCTYCYNELFHSYRRDFKKNQQYNDMISYITLK